MQSRELAVAKARRELDQIISKNAVDFKRLQEILESLQSVDVDLELLKKTKIDVTVNNVRKTFKSSKEVAKITAELIRRWKKIAKEEFRKSESSDSESLLGSPPDCSPAVQTSTTLTPNQVPAQVNSAYQQQSEVADCPNESVQTEAFASPVPNTATVRKRRSGSASGSGSISGDSGGKRSPRLPTDETRLKSIQMLEEALAMDEQRPRQASDGSGGGGSGRACHSESELEAHRLAVLVEKAIYRELKETDRKYRSRIRSRVLNLRDASNPELRKRVLSGDLSVAQVASMSSEEMANEKLREIRRSMSEEMMREHEIPESADSRSDMFQCPNCSERDASYQLSQERQEGEYEPTEVTLLLCNRCGHRWKAF